MKRKILASLILFQIVLVAYNQSWEELDNLVLKNLKIENLDTALFFAELALNTVEEQYGNEDTLYANMLALYSFVQFYRGNYEDAIEKLLLEKEIRDKKQDRSHHEYGRLLNDLGVMNEIIGNYKVAAFYYLTCLRITKETLGEKHSDYAILCSNVAVFYQIIGSYQKAKPYFILAMKIQKEILGDHHPDYATTLNNFGEFNRETGNYQQAEQYHLKALNIRKEVFGEKHTEYTQSLHNLANLYGYLGNYTKAEKLFLRIIQIEKEINGNNHPDITFRLSSLGRIYLKMGDYKRAIQYITESLIIEERAFGKKHIRYASDLNNLAAVYNDMGQFEKAESLYQESLNIIGEVFSKNHHDYSLGLYNLSWICLKTGEYERSEMLAIEALEVREKVLGEKHPNYLKSLIQLASIYFAKDENEKAELLVLKSIDQTSLNIYQNFSFLSDEEKELYLKTVSNRFDFFYSYAAERNQNNPEIASFIFNNTIRNKALLLKSSTIMRQSLLKSNDTLILNKYEKLIDLRRQLSKLYNSTKDIQLKNTDELEDQANKIEKELVWDSQIFNEYKRIQEYTWDSLRVKLKNNEAAVDIIRFKYYSQNSSDSILYAALIVTNETPNYPRLIVLKNSSEFESKYFSEYTNYINKDPVVEGFSKNDLGSVCYEIFWEEIELEVGGKDRVYFCPDGIFHKINLNTILCPDEKYVNEKKELIILNSLTELLEYKETPTEEKGSILLAGNPDFNLNKRSNIRPDTNLTDFPSNIPVHNISSDFKGQKLNKLPGSQLEVEQIDDLFNRNNWETLCLTGDKAIEETVKTTHNPRVLHLATHGFFAGDVNNDRLLERGNNLVYGQNMDKVARFPLMRSGLMFSGSQNTLDGNFDPLKYTEDGILTGYEVLNLDLRATELVVLSACETGLGEIMNGEGVYGLQRAFKIAGAQNIIMSLWKVDDMATQILMTKFYEFWLDGNSKRQAFKMAQDYLRTQTAYKRPYYWGGFVFIGNEPPSDKTSFSYFWLLLLLIPVGLLLLYRKKKKQK